MKISRSLVPAALAAVAIALVGACTSSPSGTPTPTGAATSAAATGAPTSASAPTTAASSAPVAPILTTPQAAAEHLYNAWVAKDKPTALLAASTTAVNALFAKTWKSGTYFFGGCTLPTAPSECDYNWSGGIIAMTIAGDATTGFRVTAVSTGSAG